MRYPELADELEDLLAQDQLAKQQAARHFFERDRVPEEEGPSVDDVAAQRRGERLSAILDSGYLPRVSHVGRQGVQAMAVLALHGKVQLLHQATSLFEQIARDNPDDTELSLIPALLDFSALFDGRTQAFATVWLFDQDRWPFLYPTLEVQHLQQRREAYNLGPLKWPRSLAITDDQQPWLGVPFDRHRMRWPTTSELVLNFPEMQVPSTQWLEAA